MDLEEIITESRRSGEGFRAFAASADLLGMKILMAKDRREARQRLNDFQQGFADALAFFPGGERYRVCSAGDSVFVVQELEPGEDEAALWPSFCGHIYAVTAHNNDMDRTIGNCGVRLIMASGALFQLVRPESWHKLPHADQTENWFSVNAGRKGEHWPAEKVTHLGRYLSCLSDLLPGPLSGRPGRPVRCRGACGSWPWRHVDGSSLLWSR